MSVALQLYQQLRDAPDEDARAKIIATAFEQLEDRYPNLKNVATHSDVREGELRLQKEIVEAEGRLRAEIKELEGRLQAEMKELEGRLQAEMKELEGRLQAEMKELEGRLQTEMKDLEIRLMTEMKELEGRLQKQIKEVDYRIHQVELKVAETKSELVRWVVSVGLLQTSLIIGVLLKVSGLI